MKVLITGSSGFLGSRLKSFLEKNKIKVISCDFADNPKCDVKHVAHLEERANGIEGIVHFAAVSRVKWGYEHPLECIQTNVGGISNVLETARSSKKKPWVIFGSSREVFGNIIGEPATEKNPYSILNIYTATKVAGEDLCRIYSKDYGVKTRVIRFSNVYTGKDDQLDRLVPKFILKALNSLDLEINGTGEESFDFTYIDDVIGGIWGCVQEVSQGNLMFDDFTLSTGKRTTLKELAELIIRETNSESKIVHKSLRSYDVSQFCANPLKAKMLLGFNPKTELVEGIRKSIKELKTCDLPSFR